MILSLIYVYYFYLITYTFVVIFILVTQIKNVLMIPDDTNLQILCKYC